MAAATAGIDRKGWAVLILGTLMAAGVLASEKATAVLGFLLTFIHELGHAVAGWSFGYPSLPSFDIVYGGGVTVMAQRSAMLLVLIFTVWAWLAWRFRHNRRTRLALFIALPIYAMVAFTPAHQLIILWSGHGAELVFAGVILYKAVSGTAKYQLARPLYAFLSLFLIADDIRFAWLLSSRTAFRQGYEGMKGSGFRMDFSRIAEEFLGIDVSFVAVSFLIACLMTPVFAWLFLRYQPRIAPLMVELKNRGLTPSPSPGKLSRT